ncbi:MAG TPA: hypothetical protein VJZ27_06965 [Aggregatilineales bacterium]|nr:hypothetical protein [Aggregatilineales bacterium]
MALMLNYQHGISKNGGVSNARSYEYIEADTSTLTGSVMPMGS